MKKKIAIHGSTGSIGKTLIKMIKKKKNNFNIVLLTADKNYKEILKQAKDFNVQNLIITNKKSFNELKKKNQVKLIFLTIMTRLDISLKNKLIMS